MISKFYDEIFEMKLILFSRRNFPTHVSHDGNEIRPGKIIPREFIVLIFQTRTKKIQWREENNNIVDYLQLIPRAYGSHVHSNSILQQFIMSVALND